MRLSELQQAVREADPAAVLVAPRILERVLRGVGKATNLVWPVPHRKTFVIDRQILFRYVDQEELDLEPDRRLPATVLLLARPSGEELSNTDRGTLLQKYWRRLFHVQVHRALDDPAGESKLTDEDIDRRVEKIGRTEFAEIRMVLARDNYLLPHADDRAVYGEFAALFLELRYFAANLLPVYFPGIRDLDRVEKLLTADVDAADLFTRSRLAEAPAPVVRSASSSEEAHEYYWKLVRSAEEAARAGNSVKAAILRLKAARVAPAVLAYGTRTEAIAELQRLTGRLQTALQLSDAEAAEWLKDLPTLLDKADQGSRPVEAALLYDLQRVCLDHERDIYALDLVEWILSAGSRPIKRPLPSQRLVRLTSHLRSAAQRLTMARLSDGDRQHFTRLLESALERSEERLRARIRPVLSDAFHDVGLAPQNPPERTAFHKMIEELLDRITAYGFLTFGDLRDAISRNQLKLPDLADPQEFVRGDPLLRLDRRLGTALDGVYRPSEIYIRWLERLTALGFGTNLGRQLTRFVLVPFGGAFVILEGISLILEPLHVSVPRAVHYPLLLALGCFLLALTESARLRERCRKVCKTAVWGLNAVFLEAPAWVIRQPWLHRLAHSWSFLLVYYFLFKPLLLLLLLWLWIPDEYRTAANAVAVFLGANILLNTRPGQAATAALAHGLVRFAQMLQAGFLMGLVRLIIHVFKTVIDAVDYVLFRVDEWLRFRSGESRWTMVARTILGAVWYPIAYLTRFYMVVLIEPCINPIKLPISVLAAKFVYPLLFVVGLFDVTTLSSPLVAPLGRYIGFALAWLVVVGTFYLLPDAFGFLVWELKENWSLYRANRPPDLRPAAIGAHGETMHRLLQPGFHSGTVPKLFARLRKAEREAYKTGIWRAARRCRHELHEVEMTLQRFVTRVLVSLVEEGLGWHDHPLAVGPVGLSSNRIAIELTHAKYPAAPVRLDFELCGGWLVASVAAPGWLEQLAPDQRQIFASALASLYKLAGVDLVREQVRASLPPVVAHYDVTAEGLVLWLDQRQGRAITYDLREPTGSLRPRSADGTPAGEWPVLEADRVIFAQVPLPWKEWVQGWQNGPVPPAPPNAGLGALLAARLSPALPADGKTRPPRE